MIIHSFYITSIDWANYNPIGFFVLFNTCAKTNNTNYFTVINDWSAAITLNCPREYNVARYPPPATANAIVCFLDIIYFRALSSHALQIHFTDACFRPNTCSRNLNHVLLLSGSVYTRSIQRASLASRPALVKAGTFKRPTGIAGGITLPAVGSPIS